MVPATGRMADAPSTTEMEQTNFKDVSKDQVIPEMAGFKTDRPNPSTVESRPASVPGASEDSGVDISGGHSMGHAHTSDRRDEMHAGDTSQQYTTGSRATVEPEMREADSSGHMDDFRPIEGIGPSISSLLHREGINTFSQLQHTPIDRLYEILDQAGIRQITDPTTWSEQAALCAEGKWDELTELQKTLRGGRRMP